ncbi:flagellar basal body rod protein FlgB [Aquamicrobium zhengzhouense]|uniref:Flagellar basal body rod protein FlgB n=1 Tax=Aquamicrobium zhengzhouense TaxID=2781738 RepID=A0ABS0SAQ8_9HYPH|nr:flagellar basal body rod protein FlgB [Aquamicrobium zhengzhouense]MBI1619750.1 flagellar basal body rod protein FlgB [Aquamicrobium zhengzhouense]
MQPVNLFELASQKASWLAVRQTAVSSNIANANTPGYAAVDVQPFEAVLDQKTVAMRATHVNHLPATNSGAGFSVSQANDSVPIMPSGNTVTLETELMKSGEVRRDMELNTAIVKAFHRMLLMTTRG